MADPAPSRPRVFLSQAAFLVLFLPAIFLIMVALGVFRNRDPKPRRLEYMVDGSTTVAVITFTRPDGTSSDREEVMLPWNHEPFQVMAGSMVILTAGNPSQVGSIRCTISIDGRTWKEEKADYPQDKVACAGIVP